MLLLAVFGKFGALFASIPGAILSGLFCCMFGLIVAVGISNLQFTDQNSPRSVMSVMCTLPVAPAITCLMAVSTLLRAP
jgi:solute carrier family 23 (nucleobase transporter), member 1